MEESSRIRVQEIDILRFVAIAAVVVMHTSDAAFVLGRPAGLDGYLLLWVNQATRFAIPLFLFMSGFALAYSYGQVTLAGYGPFLLKRLKAIIPAYLVWSLALMLYFRQGFTADVIFKTLLLGRADFQMYFIPLIIQFYLLYPVFIYLSRHKRRWLVAAMLFLMNLVTWIAYGYLGLGGGLRIWFFSWWFFFFMGCLLAAEKERIFGQAASAEILLLGALCLTGATLISLRAHQKIFYQGIPYANAATALKATLFIYSSATIFFFLRLSGRVMRRITGAVRVLLIDAGGASFEIFLAHTLVMRYLIGLGFLDLSSFAGSMLIALLCLAISYLGLNILSLIPYFPSRLNLRKLYANLVSLS
jgi:peptidoglycan/LPS O-acetylase OafA/YrhL